MTKAKWKVRIIAQDDNAQDENDTVESDWVEIELPKGYRPICISDYEELK